MRIAFGAGGSGGHIIPAFAIAQEFLKSGDEVFFIGNKNSMEERLCAQRSYSFFQVNVQKLYRKITLTHIRFPFLLLASIIRSRRYLVINRADAVVCTGGFVSGPIAVAAITLRIPLFFHESNSYPGLTTRLAAKYAKIVFTAFKKTSAYLKKANTRMVGIPITFEKQSVNNFDPAQYNLSENKPKLLVVGGSQGSTAINNCIHEAMPQIVDLGFDVLWQTGAGSFNQYQALYQHIKGVYVFGFSSDLPSFYQNAYIAITRAGAMTIAELETMCLPAIMIPLPSSAENHQYHNAKEQEQKGLAIVLEQRHLHSHTLIQKIKDIMVSYNEFKSRFAGLSENKAASTIAQEIRVFLDSRSNHVR